MTNQSLWGVTNFYVAEGEHPYIFTNGLAGWACHKFNKNRHWLGREYFLEHHPSNLYTRFEHRALGSLVSSALIKIRPLLVAVLLSASLFN
ncbi:MAG: hypothetical protein JWP57_1521 [Spirosoma sp.]|nr:hypothetical protein [Spirosoma sp.]